MKSACENVVLIHGIWTRGWEVMLLKRRFAKEGFNTFAFSYPTLSKSVEENALALWKFIRKRVGEEGVCLVGHSYGGLIACVMMNNMASGTLSRSFKVDRCIFLGTPIQGSSVAKHLSTWLPFRLVTGKSLPALKNGCKLQATRVETLMVAGSVNIGLGMFFIDKGDGVVATEETMARWLTAHCSFKVTHLGLVLSKKVAETCIKFLRGQSSCV